ncbi:MAG: aldehyde dehydrogenase family protein [Actinobacteria bacterium]|nr:aldehyde dehydrogenase family protein [Actinomycetota bacterium]
MIAPTVFEDVFDDGFLSCEEVFGPVVSLYRFDDFDDALSRANAVPFGLAAGVSRRVSSRRRVFSASRRPV